MASRKSVERDEPATDSKPGDGGQREGLFPLLDGPQLLAKAYRKRKLAYDLKSVHPSDAPDEEAKGWTVQRPGKRSSRLRRPKRHDRALEDRTWCLFYTMGYPVMNAEGLKLRFARDNGSVGTKQVDVYAEDGETALVVECKSREAWGRRSLQKDIQETISLQRYFRAAIRKRFEGKPQPKVVWLYVTENVRWSAQDMERAEAGDIRVITENDFQYYETFIRHMGPAGRYQILGEFLKGQKIPGLSEVKLPAIRGKIGGETYYSFVATPRHLLRIAFVNHQALNHADGRPAYQRMISASRIKETASFIRSGGYFPTNILVNFSDSLRFDLISNKENKSQAIKFGWVTLPTRYRSAWIIDGQHRLYGFSRLDDKYLDQDLFVLGFEKMAVEKEADLFVTINHKQKSVPRSLLVSLLADIRLGDDDPATALDALGSAIVRRMNQDKASPLAGRFGTPGIPPAQNENLTISEAVNGLRRAGLIGERVKDTIVPGPLTDSTDERTIERAASVLNAYFGALRKANPTRWAAGRGAYISVNPGIRAHMVVIGEVIRYLSYKRPLDFSLMSKADVADEVVGFCAPIFDLIRDAPDEEIRSKFSRRFGEGGVKEYGYYLMQVVLEETPDFGSDEFRRWVEQSTSDRIDKVNQFLMKLAERLTNHVIDTLKVVHGTQRLESDEQAFWELGVESPRIRKSAYEAQQRDKTRRRPKEAYLNIIDLMEIVKQQNNWVHFERVFHNPRPGERKGKKYYLDWMQAFNELRNIAAHKNQLKTYTDEDLDFVEWLMAEVDPKVPA